MFDEDLEKPQTWRIRSRSDDLGASIKHIQAFIKKNKLEKYCSEPSIYKEASGRRYIKIVCAQPIAEKIVYLPNILGLDSMSGSPI
jgi:hypothetical protein